jgi:glycosyltransferase involved in cell wall biosynthesis
MTNVLMVTKYFHPSLGGVETHVHEISSELARRDYSVRIIAPSIPNHTLHERVGNVDVLRFPVFSFKRIDFSPCMQSFVRTTRFDVAHFHTFEILCRTLRFCLRKGTPYFITPQKSSASPEWTVRTL